MDEGEFRHLVVVAEDGAIEGVLSSSRVKDVMHREVVTVDPATSLPEAAALLRERKIGCLPVVEADRLVGLITEGDFVLLVAGAIS